jgi:hypothetical protein
MIAEIAGWEATHALDDPGWQYYERWLAVLERLVGKVAGPATGEAPAGPPVGGDTAG